MESAVELNWLLLKLVFLCHMDIQETLSWIFRKLSLGGNVKFNFLGINWDSKRSWRVHFLSFQRACNPKIFILVVTMVLPRGYTGFIANLPFWATLRLEHVLNISPTNSVFFTSNIFSQVSCWLVLYPKIASFHNFV